MQECLKRETAKFAPHRRKPVYFTETYNCYSQQFEPLFNHIISKMTERMQIRPQDDYIILDLLRDELASILSAFGPDGKAALRTFATARLKVRIPNILKKYRVISKRNGGLFTSLRELSSAEDCPIENTKEYSRSVGLINGDSSEQQKKLALIAEVDKALSLMPENLRLFCIDLMNGNNATEASEKAGISRQNYYKNWLPKLRTYLQKADNDEKEEC